MPFVVRLPTTPLAKKPLTPSPQALDSRLPLSMQCEDVQGHLACPDPWTSFQLIQAEDVDRILGGVRPVSCVLDLSPSWLIQDARAGLLDWLGTLIPGDRGKNSCSY